MKKKKLILQAGADGGSIKLLQINENFFYTTDETTLRDFDPELTLDELRSESDVFPTFTDAMKSMLERYSIFSLYPLEVNAGFKNKITPYFQGFCCGSKHQQNWNLEYWEKILQ